MKLLSLLVLAAFSLLSESTAAQPSFPPLTDDQRDNLAADYARCAAYFTYAQVGLRRSGQSELAQMSHAFGKNAMAYSVILSTTGRTQEMALKVAEARYKLGLESMGRNIENDFSNISVIVSKYGTKCTTAVTKPEEYARTYIGLKK